MITTKPLWSLPIAMQRERSPGHAEQIDYFLLIAASDESSSGAAKLARRMLDAGISLFAPDPERARCARRPAA
jgi:hypothetical protein